MTTKNIKAVTVLNNGDFIEKSANEFKGSARKTAQSILEMGRIVFNARETLKKDKAGFEEFCARIGHKSASKSIVKLAQIGKGFEMLNKQVECLPNNWTTLYEISRLTEEQFNEFVNKGLIHQNAIGSQIKLLTGDANFGSKKKSAEVTELVPNGTLSGLQFACTIENIKDDETVSRIKSLLSLIQEEGVKVVMAPDLKVALETNMLKVA